MDHSYEGGIYGWVLRSTYSALMSISIRCKFRGFSEEVVSIAKNLPEMGQLMIDMR